MNRVFIAFALVLAACAPVTTPASPTPSSTPSVATTPVPTSTVAVTSTPTASSDPGRYGYIVPSGGRIVVRAERSNSVDNVIAVGGEQPAASPDGKRVAFWRTGPQGNNSQELRIVDLPGGTERMLMSIPAGSIGGPIVWSSDGTGLLYAVHSAALFPGAGGGPRSSRLESFDMSVTPGAGASDSQLMLSNGSVFVPLGWDKAGALSTALVTGEGGQGRSYVTWDRRVQPAGQSAVTFSPFPWQVTADTVQASYDAKRMLAIDGGANVLRIWPAADIAAADQVGPGTTGKIMDARWRPGPRLTDVAWVLDQNVGVFTYQTSSVGTIHRGQATVRIMAWRVDGSGIVLYEFGRGALVVDMSSGQATTLSGFDGVIAGAVLLR